MLSLIGSILVSLINSIVRLFRDVLFNAFNITLTVIKFIFLYDYVKKNKENIWIKLLYQILYKIFSFISRIEYYGIICVIDMIINFVISIVYKIYENIVKRIIFLINGNFLEVYNDLIKMTKDNKLSHDIFNYLKIKVNKEIDSEDKIIIFFEVLKDIDFYYLLYLDSKYDYKNEEIVVRYNIMKKFINFILGMFLICIERRIFRLVLELMFKLKGNIFLNFIKILSRYDVIEVLYYDIDVDIKSIDKDVIKTDIKEREKFELKRRRMKVIVYLDKEVGEEVLQICEKLECDFIVCKSIISVLFRIIFNNMGMVIINEGDIYYLLFAYGFLDGDIYTFDKLS